MSLLHLASRIIRTTIVQIISILFLVHFASGQSQDLQRHIDGISNSQLIGNGSYFKQVVLQSEAADSIVAVADKMPVYENRQVITKRLLPLLTDSIQGIAVHYVLCAIWKRQSGFDRGGFVTSEISYHRLTFYEKDQRYVTDREELLANQQRWAKFIRQ